VRHPPPFPQRSIRRLFVIGLSLAWTGAVGRAATPRDFATDLQATIADEPPRITLNWTPTLQTQVVSQTLYRRFKGGKTWIKLSDLEADQARFADATADPGIEYEYRLHRSFSAHVPDHALGYLSAGIRIPEVQDRGILLLVLEDALLVSMWPEIERLTMDLTADGWRVQPLPVARSESPTAVRKKIQEAYASDPSQVRLVYLLGRVPVPYSGNLVPDGHTNHQGAWPADGYYGEMSSHWSDTTVTNITAGREANRNVPGDGKFDPGVFPSQVELGVGRVDMWNLKRSPSSSVSEEQLLRRYLRKAHDYRHKQGAYSNIPRRSLIRDGFGYFRKSEPFAVSAWALAFTAIDRNAIDEAPAGQWFSQAFAGGKDYLWGFGCGGGSHEYANTLGVSTDFGRQSSRVVFTGVFGSYHGDWDTENNLMRSILAGNPEGDSLALSCLWAGRPHWFLHSLGMGETLGFAARDSMNASVPGGSGYSPAGPHARGVHMALLGDPALRLHGVEPPRHVRARSARGKVFLMWKASEESGLQGYHVYRADSPTGPYVRLTPIALASPGFTDESGQPGVRYAYLVRTLKLEQVPGGSYFNLSVGSPISISVVSEAEGSPWNPSALRVESVQNSVHALIAWEDHAEDEEGFVLERRVNTGEWQPLARVASDQTRHVDSGPFLPDHVYRYRVAAAGSNGLSAWSNEDEFEAGAGFVEFLAPQMTADSGSDEIEIPVRRFGGGIGPARIHCAVEDVSALAGKDAVAVDGGLHWADGEQGEKKFRISILKRVESAELRPFRVVLTDPVEGVGRGVWDRTALLLTNAPAQGLSPWQQKILGSVTHSTPAVSVSAGIASALIGGSGLTEISTSESGRFVYREWEGDGQLTLRISDPVPVQNAARFALAVRGDPAPNAIQAAVVSGSPGAQCGARLVGRSTPGAGLEMAGGTNSFHVPGWFRIRREGNDFTSYYSSDGRDWTLLGSPLTLSNMPPKAVWGFFHLSANAATSSTGLGDYQVVRFEEIGLE
ncbi:MAG: hypothetical protein U1E27_10155, partial [Kiritimatiellia bacterium]|nr:hypothetical protein [Kiritimatiellia bacterium]